MFGIGAMIGMACITSSLAYPLLAFARRPQLIRVIAAGAGGLSVCLGISIELAMVRTHV